MLHSIKAFRGRYVSNSAGFTLVEVAVSLSILSLGLALVGAGIFQVLSVQRFWRDDLVATKEVRHAGSWFSGDALNATATDLVDNAQAVPTVTLTLSSGNIVYSVSGTDLIRQAGSDQNIVATDVVSVGFSRSGQLLTLTLEVQASRGGTETLSLQNFMRLMES